MDAAKYIAALKDEQAATALEALRNPRGRDGFEFGHACGMIQGFQRALDILEAQQEEEDPRKPKKTVRAPSNPYLSYLDDAPTLPEEWANQTRKR